MSASVHEYARTWFRLAFRILAAALLIPAGPGAAAPPPADVATGERYAGRVLAFPSFPLEVHVRLRGQEIHLHAAEPFGRTATNSTAPAGAGEAIAGGGYWVVGPAAWETAMDKFIRGQRALGWDARYLSIDSILSAYAEFEDQADALRAALTEGFVQGIGYALLVGDATVLPIRYASDVRTDSTPALDQLQICDLFFADVDGAWDADHDGVYGEPIDDSADLAAELLLGRLPFSRFQEAAAWCAKWEQYVFARGDVTYLGRALGLSSDQMRDDVDGAGQAALVARAWPTSIAHDSVSLLERPSGVAAEPDGPWAADVLDRWSTGWGIVQMFVHGRWDGFALKTAAYNTWPKSYVLTDPAASGAHEWLGRLNGPAGVVYSVACNQAAFDASTVLGGPPGQRCVATELLASPNGGAVAFVGYSRWGWVYTSYRIAQAFWEGVFDSAYTAAAALQMAKLRFPYLRDVAYGHNLYGDPALRIWRGIPRPISASLPERVSAAGASWILTADVQGEPLVSRVTIMTEDGLVLFGGVTDHTGQCAINLGVLPPQPLLVTVSAEGYAPFQDTLIVSIASGADDDPSRPRQFSLDNYPNPFNAQTRLRVQSSGFGRGRLVLFNQLGQQVREWELELYGKMTTVIWDGTSASGEPLPSGVYFARLEDGNNEVSRKLLMLK